VNAACLGVILWRRGHLDPDRRLKRRAAPIAAATACMVAALLIGEALLAGSLRGPAIARIGALAALIALGGGAYALACHVLGAARWGELRQALARQAARP